MPAKARKLFIGRLVVAAAILVSVAAFAASSPYSGHWFIEPSSKQGEIEIGLKYERHSESSNYNSSHSWDAPMSQAVGLTSDVLNSSGTKGAFKLVRDAGTFECEGWFNGGRGTGTFNFAASPQFASELKKRGIDTVSEEQQFRMAMAGVSLELVDTLKAAHYEFDSEDLVRTANHGVTLDYIKEINALGYHPESLRGLIRMRDHGVTPEYVKAIQASGLKNLGEEEVVKLRDHGVTPEYIAGLGQYGIKDLDAWQLTKLRDHGVTPEYIAEMRKAGYTASSDELTKLRDHGVTPEYIKALRDAKITDLSMEDVVKLRDHGVSPEFIAEARAAGFSGLSAHDLTKLRDHGVGADYLKRHGKGRSVEELIRMHDHGQDGTTI